MAAPPLPEGLIAAPPLVVQRLVRDFATLEPALRLRAVPVVVHWYGVDFPWPTLSSDEAHAFARTPSRPHFPGDRRFLFGDAHATAPGDLDTFLRCLSIAASWYVLGEESLTGAALVAGVPTIPAGPEEARIASVFLDVPPHEGCNPFLRETIVAFLLTNERWRVFDDLAAGFAAARGSSQGRDLVFGALFPEHRERIDAIRTRWLEADARGLEQMKLVWQAESEVLMLAQQRFTSHQQVKTALGTKVFLGLLSGGGNNRDASRIAMTWPVLRQGRGAHEKLGQLDVRAVRSGREWTLERLEFTADSLVIDALAD